MKQEAYNGKRKIVFYGRVSTEHEAQLSALENQMQWYDDQLKRHEKWELIEKYIDRGITGTKAKKRPSFMQMIKDAEKGEFDLIVTREVCRFARNTVDTLEYTRKLKKLGVEVYFVEDNIWTFNSDGELRLTIMAALAQEESRKDSERVKAGQKISRDNGVLFGNGNILGYDLYRKMDESGKWNPSENTYIINSEQAETVRMIYDMYFEGMGYGKICKELCRLNRKDAYGKVSWSASKIGRILHNMTYAGYKVYNKSYVDDFLEHSRVTNLNRNTYIYVKGDWEPIITEEHWKEVQRICNEKSSKLEIGGSIKMKGKRTSDDIWLKKLRCSCGSSYRKNKWRRNKGNGEDIFGYQCYNQVNNGSAKFREKYGITTEGFCDIPMVADWKLHFMVKRILEKLWTDRQETVEEAIRLIKCNYIPEKNAALDKMQISNLETKIKKNEERIKRLLEMRMDNEISKDEYLGLKERLESENQSYRIKLEKKENIEENKEDLDSKLAEIRETLKMIIDFSGDRIDDNIINKLVHQIIPTGNNKFKCILNLLGNDKCYLICGVDGRKNKTSFTVIPSRSLSLFQDSTGCYR